MPTLEVDVVAKLDSLQKELANIPGIGEKEAKKLAKGMSKELATIARNGKATASELKRANEAAFGDIKRAGDKMTGGLVGDVDDLAQGVGGLVTAIGPVGAIAGVAAVGMAAMGGAALAAASAIAYGSVSLVRGADEAIDRLGALEGVSAAAIDPALSADVREATASLDGLSVVQDRLTAELGGRLAPAVDRVAQVVIKFGLIVADNADTIASATATTIAWTDALGITSVDRMSMALEGLNVLTGSYDAQAEQLRNTLDAQRQAAETVADVQAKVGERHREVEAAERKRAASIQAMTKAQDEAMKVQQEAIALQMKARDLSVSMTAGELDASGKIEAAYRQRIAVIGQMQTDGLKRSEVSILLDQAEAERVTAAGALERAEAQTTTDARIAFSRYVYAQSAANRAADTAEMQRAEELARAEAQRTADEQIRQREGVRDAGLSIATSLTAGIDGLLQTQVEAAENAKGRESAAYKKAATIQWAASKATGLIDVGIKTAQSVMAGFALFGPPPSPAGIGAAIAAGVAGAAQATIIAASPPPTFHGGSSMVGQGMSGGTGGRAPDEIPANLQQGEAVITGRAARQLGRDNIDAMNRGESVNGGNIEVNVWVAGERQKPDRVTVSRGKRGRIVGQRPYERG